MTDASFNEIDIENPYLMEELKEELEISKPTPRKAQATTPSGKGGAAQIKDFR